MDIVTASIIFALGLGTNLLMLAIAVMKIRKARKRSVKTLMDASKIERRAVGIVIPSNLTIHQTAHRRNTTDLVTGGSVGRHE